MSNSQAALLRYFCVTFFLAIPIANAAPGDFDPSFGQNGIVTISGPGTSLGTLGPNGEAKAISSDGKGNLLVVGTSNLASVFARLTLAGVLDSQFAGTGYLVRRTATPPYEFFQEGRRAYPIAAGDTILVEATYGPCVGSGFSCGFQSYASLGFVKVHAGGNVDPNYGVSGMVVLTKADGATIVDPDGALTVFSRVMTDPLTDYFAVERLDANGQRNSVFEQTVTSALACGSQFVVHPAKPLAARQLDGRILVVQQFRGPNLQGTDLCVTRLNPDGTLDPAFGIAGHTVVSDPLLSMHYPFQVMVRTDGGIEILMLDAPLGQLHQPVMVWLRQNGTLDTTGGRQAVDRLGGAIPASITAAILQPDDKILVSGYASTRIMPVVADLGKPIISRVDARGQAADLSFGTTGFASLVTRGGTRIVPDDLLVGVDGAIYVAGGAGPTDPAMPTQFAIAKLLGVLPPEPPQSNSSGGGGCGFTRNGPFDPTLPALTLMAACYLLLRRRKIPMGPPENQRRA